MEVVNRDNSKVTLYKNVITGIDFKSLYEEIKWEQERVIVYGQLYTPDRLKSAQGNITYRYSGIDTKGKDWTPTVLKIKKVIEDKFGAKVNFCLCNYYPNGKSSLGYHSDNEPSIVKNSDIYSVNFGVSRKFHLKHKDGTRYDCILSDGDILIMSGETQQHFKHELPKMLKVTEPRINLTFRLMKE